MGGSVRSSLRGGGGKTTKQNHMVVLEGSRRQRKKNSHLVLEGIPSREEASLGGKNMDPPLGFVAQG
ncbi:hypothetical protein RJT34_04945 [Clitoria ternatea]|uniref:Uncharacterized protein n=1 Tax=Clitoria ternatea TaxID=43366 RepID=A0AAN9Q3V5_CLITE